MVSNSQTTTRSVSDNIRSSVRNRLEEGVRRTSSNTIVSPLAQSIKALPAQERNSRLLQSAIALNRVASGDNFTASQNQVNDFAVAVNIIAEKRGITSQKNGKFSNSQLKKELAPSEVMKYFAAQTLADSDDEEVARRQISDDITSVYENETAPDSITSLKNIPSYASDEDFLSMDEEAQNNYLSSRDIAEQTRLNELLTQKKSYPDGIDPNEIAEFKGRTEDPDWGHKKDDDNFKIEQGDIIDYLMKEVILASAAWAANKASGFVGIVSYEILSGAHRNVVKPGWKKTKEKVSKMFEHEEKPDKIFTNFSNTYSNNTEAYERAITAHEAEDPTKGKLYKYFQNIITNQAVIDNDKIYEMTGENTGTSKPLSEISSSSDIKESLIKFRNQMRQEQLEYLLSKHPNRSDSVIEWFNKRMAWEEDNTKTLGHPTIPNPGNEFTNDLEAVRKTQIENIALFPIKNRLEAQMNLFAEHYGAYKFLEMARLNPKNKALHSDDKYKEFMKQIKAEAKFIFLTAAKKRANGERVLSSEAMIEEAKKLAQTSQDKLDHEKPGEVKDTKLITIVDAENINTDENPVLMSEYAQSPQNQYAEAMFGIEQREKELGRQTSEINNRRAMLEKARQHTLNKTNNSIDIAKKYQDIKRGRS